jgi:hypothetical protein
MEGWLAATGFKVVSIKEWESDAPPYGGQRMIGVAEKSADLNEQIEHPLY